MMTYFSTLNVYFCRVSVCSVFVVFITSNLLERSDTLSGYISNFHVIVLEPARQGPSAGEESGTLMFDGNSCTRLIEGIANHRCEIASLALGIIS